MALRLKKMSMTEEQKPGLAKKGKKNNTNKDLSIVRIMDDQCMVFSKK